MSALAPADHLVPCLRCRSLVRPDDLAAHEEWHALALADEVVRAARARRRRSADACGPVLKSAASRLADPSPVPSFAQLRELGMYSALARACIELRKQEIRALDWTIRCERGDPGPCPDAVAAARALRYMNASESLRTWLGTAAEEILVADALSLYVVSAKGARQAILRSGVAGLEILDGAAIWPILNTSGEPSDEFAQYAGPVERRTIAQALRAMTPPSAAAWVAVYGRDALLYRPCWIRPGTLFGCSPVERAMVLTPAGDIDMAATEKKLPGEFGIGPAALGMRGPWPVSVAGEALPKILRRHLKSVLDWFLQETCGAPHLRWEWQEEE